MTSWGVSCDPLSANDDDSKIVDRDAVSDLSFHLTILSSNVGLSHSLKNSSLLILSVRVLWERGRRRCRVLTCLRVNGVHVVCYCKHLTNFHSLFLHSGVRHSLFL